MQPIITVRCCSGCSTSVSAFFFSLCPSSHCSMPQEANLNELLHCPVDLGWDWPKEGTSRRLNGGKKVRLIQFFPWLFPAGSQSARGYIPLLRIIAPGRWPSPPVGPTVTTPSLHPFRPMSGKVLDCGQFHHPSLLSLNLDHTFINSFLLIFPQCHSHSFSVPFVSGWDPN